MYTGYLWYNCTEIGNNERVLAYLRGNPFLGVPGLKQPNTVVSPDCGCTGAHCLYLDQGSGDDGEYLSPRLDDAPWYDPDVPDSADFAGFFIEDVTGFDSVVRRDVSDGAISGSSLGPLRLGGRCMTFSGWLRAKTCCGAEYGLRWLTEALMGSGSCDDCAMGDAYMIKCCPPASDTCHTESAGTTDVDDAKLISFSITDVGGGIYDITIDDPLQANVISDPAAGVNNTLGAIPLYNLSSYSFRFVIEDSIGAIFTFLVPADIITSFVTAPSGVGASATITVDTTTDVGDCDDAEQMVDRFTSQLSDYFAQHGSGVLVSSTVTTAVEAFDLVDGINPNDYVRLMHRVGLTDGPNVTDRAGTCCSADCGCVNLRVEFTLCSELPYIFSDLEWCLRDATFDLLETTCIDLRDVCGTCQTLNTTKFAEREVRRPNCNITIRHDGTWCIEDWPDSAEGCPPDDCLLTIGSIEEYDPDTVGSSDAAQVTQLTVENNELSIRLHDDLTWSPDNFNPEEGFPPDYADITISNGGTCGRPATDPDCVQSGSSECEFEVQVAASPAFTWTPVNWDPAVQGFPPSPCQIVVTPGICECPSTGAAPEGAVVFGDGSWFDPDTCTCGCEPCGSCNPCQADGDCDPDGTPNKCPIKLIWNKATGDYTFEILVDVAGAGGETTYGDCDCFEVVEFCIEGVEPCLVRVIYDSGTGEQLWEPIRWSGDIPAPDTCDCILIAELVVRNSVASTTGCGETTDCPINVICTNDYRPTIAASRQSVAAFFYRYNGSPPFTPPITPTFGDVETTNEFYLEIEWAISVGLMQGYSNGRFKPDGATSRQAMAAFFYRDAGSPGFITPGVPTFSDVGLTHPFFLEIEWAYAQGIFTGYSDGTFRPANALSRQAAAATFYRYAGSPAFAPPTTPSFGDVGAGHPFYVEIEWMRDEGIAFGFVSSRRWEPIGWSISSTEAFPPPDCNLFIQTVNGATPETGPIRELVEVPWDEFVPECGPFPIPPPAPTLITTDCFCEPWETARLCCTFRNPADWNEATSYIEVFTGSAPMKRLKIQAYRNPFGDRVPCPCDPNDDFWSCRTPCASVLIPELPEASRLIIDSRQKTAQLVLVSGRVVNALRYVFSEDGMPFEWFDIGPCSTFCIVVSVDSSFVAADATVSIGSAGRYVASGW